VEHISQTSAYLKYDHSQTLRWYRFFNVVKVNSQTVSPLTYNSSGAIKMTVQASYAATHKLLPCCGYIPSACHTGTYTYLLRYIRCAVRFDDNANDNGDVLTESD
jgi:hypothetical protein